MQLILLSAGRGSRLSKRLRSKPKSLANVNDKSIIEHNLEFFKKFKNKYIITGYKQNLLSSFAKKYDFKMVHNKNFQTTNMVYSMFLPSKFIKDDVVICYGDIIFDPNIFKFFAIKENMIPLNINWLNIWKKRMSNKDIKEDAEDVVIKKNYLLSIGGKIINKYPKHQYMGIFKLRKNSYHKLNNFFKKLKKPKIDMTSFINISIKKINLYVIRVVTTVDRPRRGRWQMVRPPTSTRTFSLRVRFRRSR